jgi:carboxymethylenebutenolidase
MPDELRRLIQDYEESRISRRQFIYHSVAWTGSVAAAITLGDSLLTLPAHAAQVDPGDPALISNEVKFGAVDGAAIGGYLTRPKGEAQRPAVVVIHEWAGINDHIRDVARRLAKAGYVALAPDLLSRQGGTSSFPTSEAAIAAGRKLDDETITKDLTGAVAYLKGQSFVRANKVGVTGFCWGGGKALMFTTRSKDLAASVIYYGASPGNVDDVKNITAPVLAHYGELDERINSGLPKLAEAMKKYGKSFEYKMYAGAPHSFNSDNDPQSYREGAAKEAWAKTLEFFKKHLQD